MTLSMQAKRNKRLEAAQGYLMLDLPDRALEELDSLDQFESCEFAIEMLRGECLRQKEDYYDALAAYHAALAIKPDDLTVQLGMAWCFKRIDRLSEAIAVMERAYRSHPKEPIVLYNLSCYFALADNKPQSLSWLGRALRMERSLRTLISEESDFNGLRDDPDFQFIVGQPDPSDC